MRTLEPVRRLLTDSPPTVAPLLLGARLTSTFGAVVTIRVTEVEAYGGVGQDPGSHAHRRRTDRNRTMFGAPGHAYIYFTYGMHWCLNVVAHPDGVAGAVLIRAGEVVQGIGTATSRRPSARVERDLARGPARLAAALGVTGELDGIDLLDMSSPLRLEGVTEPGGVLHRPDEAGRGICVGPRTGVAGQGASTPWRFWLEGERTVSPHRAAVKRTQAP